MSIVSFLIFIVVLAVIAYMAHWIITKFLPAPIQMPALAVVGILLLLVLLVQFWPEAGNYRLWK